MFFIFSTITLTLIAGLVNVITHQMEKQIHVIVSLTGFHPQSVCLIFVNKQVWWFWMRYQPARLLQLLMKVPKVWTMINQGLHPTQCFYTSKDISSWYLPLGYNFRVTAAYVCLKHSYSALSTLPCPNNVFTHLLPPRGRLNLLLHVNTLNPLCC